MDLVAGVRKEGSRGGRGEFKWSDVQSSQHRENYLGHSVMAPVGRWQQGRDLQWYSKDKSAEDITNEEGAFAERQQEIQQVKEAENEALNRALGLNPNLTFQAALFSPGPDSSAREASNSQHLYSKHEASGDRTESRREQSHGRGRDRRQRQNRNRSIDNSRQSKVSDRLYPQRQDTYPLSRHPAGAGVARDAGMESRQQLRRSSVSPGGYRREHRYDHRSRPRRDQHEQQSTRNRRRPTRGSRQKSRSRSRSPR